MAMQSGDTIVSADIFGQFATNFVAFANANIVYGNNALHFADQPQTITNRYGAGGTAGIVQSAFNGTNPIKAQEIRDYISNQVALYSRIRNARVTRNVTASGTNANGTIVQTSTSFREGISNMAASDAGTGYVTPTTSSNIQATLQISAPLLSQFMTDSKNNYVSGPRAQLLSGASMTFSVCHNSCHSNCHQNRGRR